MYGNAIGDAIATMMIICIIVTAAVAIGLEHLIIWLWHHLSIHWN